MSPEGAQVIEGDFRMLCARREGQHLDFKEKFYESSDNGNAELAKDIMAIANTLPLGATGHILFGVREMSDGTGEICGCSIAPWITDSNLQQKVRGSLNRIPSFSLHALKVDGFDVLAVKITSGGRPFYPLRDKGGLRRHVALVRIGSATEVASPDEILEWARLDDTLGIRTLEADRLRAELAVAASIRRQPGSGMVGQAQIADFAVRNLGEKPIRIMAAAATWTYREEFVRAIGNWPSTFKPYNQARNANITLQQDGAQPGQDAIVRVLVEPPPEESVLLSSRSRATQTIPFAQVELTVRCGNMAGMEAEISGSGTL